MGISYTEIPPPKNSKQNNQYEKNIINRIINDVDNCM